MGLSCRECPGTSPRASAYWPQVFPAQAPEASSTFLPQTHRTNNCPLLPFKNNKASLALALVLGPGMTGKGVILSHRERVCGTSTPRLSHRAPHTHSNPLSSLQPIVPTWGSRPGPLGLPFPSPTVAEKGPERAQEGQGRCSPKKKDEESRQMVASSKNVRANTT